MVRPIHMFRIDWIFRSVTKWFCDFASLICFCFFFVFLLCIRKHSDVTPKSLHSKVSFIQMHCFESKQYKSILFQKCFFLCSGKLLSVLQNSTALWFFFTHLWFVRTALLLKYRGGLVTGQRKCDFYSSHNSSHLIFPAFLVFDFYRVYCKV